MVQPKEETQVDREDLADNAKHANLGGQADVNPIDLWITTLVIPSGGSRDHARGPGLGLGFLRGADRANLADLSGESSLSTPGPTQRRYPSQPGRPRRQR